MGQEKGSVKWAGRAGLGHDPGQMEGLEQRWGGISLCIRKTCKALVQWNTVFDLKKSDADIYRKRRMCAVVQHDCSKR